MYMVGQECSYPLFLKQMDFALILPMISWLRYCHTETTSSFSSSMSVFGLP